MRKSKTIKKLLKLKNLNPVYSKISNKLKLKINSNPIKNLLKLKKLYPFYSRISNKLKLKGKSKTIKKLLKLKLKNFTLVYSKISNKLKLKVNSNSVPKPLNQNNLKPVYSKLSNKQIDYSEITNLSLNSGLVQPKIYQGIKKSVSEILEYSRVINKQLSLENKIKDLKTKDLESLKDSIVEVPLLKEKPLNPDDDLGNLMLLYRMGVERRFKQKYPNKVFSWEKVQAKQKQRAEKLQNRFKIKGNKPNKFTVLLKGPATQNKELGKIKTNSIPKPKPILSKYLKIISKFDQNLALSKYIVYNFNKANNITKNFKIDPILGNLFHSMHSVMGAPVYSIAPNKLTINLFYYISRLNKYINFSLNNLFLKKQINFLSKKIKNRVVLDLIEMNKPTLDSQIYTNAMGFIANNHKNQKNKRNIMRIIRKFFRKTRIFNPTKIRDAINIKKLSGKRLSILTGIKVKFGGRLSGQNLIPKRTTKSTYKGTLNRAKTDLITKSRFTATSRRGAFSITVTMGHKFC